MVKAIQHPATFWDHHSLESATLSKLAWKAWINVKTPATRRNLGRFWTVLDHFGVVVGKQLWAIHSVHVLWLLLLESCSWKYSRHHWIIGFSFLQRGHQKSLSTGYSRARYGEELWVLLAIFTSFLGNPWWMLGENRWNNYPNIAPIPFRTSFPMLPMVFPMSSVLKLQIATNSLRFRAQNRGYLEDTPPDLEWNPKIERCKVKSKVSPW